MASRLWTQLRTVVTSGVRQQVTRAGLLFTRAVALVFLVAFASANNLPFSILAAMLSTPHISRLIRRRAGIANPGTPPMWRVQTGIFFAILY